MTPTDKPQSPAASPARREFLRQGGLAAAGALVLAGGLTLVSRRPGAARTPAAAGLPDLPARAYTGPYDTTEPMSALSDITG